MATPQEKLAESLEALKALQERGVVAIRAADLARTHRERLVRNGFLQEVMKGWYIPARPDGPAGESTAWYTSFWAFCAAFSRNGSAMTGAWLPNAPCPSMWAIKTCPGSSLSGLHHQY